MNIKTILVVEDEPAIRRTLTDILVGAYEVLAVDSADEGLRIGLDLSGPVDLLLANVVLPGMLGTELATRLRKARPAMRVILIDGKEGGTLKMLHSGWQVLPKPHTGAILLERVHAELAIRATAKG